ncbi:hypothetical protein BUALT_Bualt02G0120100 [Buddleja alternifolia]|uniref:Protein CHUP1, chloroplastic n=1 Tax=Buddleja alternifolia TaxID=168488 RepID=A0AAV6Y847_9LAMI|nr:hypothetical protein BUALT_Bualt02G0120100 [Buddleja alternifolia]
MMMVKGKRYLPIKPVHLKFGVALAISVGGILYTYLRTKRINPSKSKPSHLSPCFNGSLASSRGESGDHSDGHGALQNTRLLTEDDEQKREIKSLKNKIKILEEREKNLEKQLLEYHGLKEQENAVMELQNRLRLNNMEAKLYNLNIESLKSDNERQVADYAKAVYELEAAKAKIKLLKEKLRFEAENNREHISILQEKVMKMQTVDEDVEMQIQKRNKMKEELEELRKSNKGLETVNSDLAQKLECVQMPATTSALKKEEVQELKEKSNLLKQQNADLTKEIERLQDDHCKDMEELVYLRWINACLRYELKKHQPDPSKNVYRDVSKKVSPKSECINDSDFDSDRWSSSQASSCLTDSCGNDDSSVDTNKKTKVSSKRTKVFTKLKKLLSGKGFRAPNAPLERAASVDDIAGRYSNGSSRHCSFESRGQNSSTGETSNSSRGTSDDGSSSVSTRIDSQSEYDNDWSPSTQPHQEAQKATENESVKCDKARAKSLRKRSSSFNSG